MFEPNWKTSRHKDKISAIYHILKTIEQSPGCAGLDGKIGIMLGDGMIVITPKKRKKEEEI